MIIILARLSNILNVIKLKHCGYIAPVLTDHTEVALPYLEMGTHQPTIFSRGYSYKKHLKTSDLRQRKL